MAILKLIMIDELGDEVEVESFNLHLLTDEDEIDVWKAVKEAKYAEMYPEARGFYWEDRSQWNSIINMMLNDETLDFEEAAYRGYAENAPCDTCGYCPYSDGDCELHCNN